MKLKYVVIINILANQAAYSAEAVKVVDGVDPAGPFKQAEEEYIHSNYKKSNELYRSMLPTFVHSATPKQLIRAQTNRGEVCFALRDFKEGHPLFEARLLDREKHKPLQKPWDGQKYTTGTWGKQLPKIVLVRYQHGIGDSFFFTPFMKKMHDEGITVILRERGFLKPLFSRQSYISKVISSDEEEKALTYDADVYTMSLAGHVSNKGLEPLETVDDIPSYRNGSMEPRDDLVKKWKMQFSDQRTLHVFIAAYRASANVAGETRRLERDCPIADLIKAIARPGVKIYHGCGGDHYPISRSKYNQLKAEGKLGNLDEKDIVEDADMSKIVLFAKENFDSKEVGSFEDTLAVMGAIGEVDGRVVGVDTSTGMLAGALGDKVKAFTLLPKESDWRWGEGQSKTTPFFANTTLFWQASQGDWSKPLAELGETIKKESESKE